MSKNGFVFWEDDKVVGILTGLSRWSENSKTGPMIQSWILVRETDPVDALFRGKDELVCGSCPLRGVKGKGRLCYVNLATAPYNIWQCWKRGDYPKLDVRSIVGRTLRLGSYGDPVAVPVNIWSELIANADGHTGYTHQWRTHPEFKPLVMASCDTAVEQIEAVSQGWRTFRVKRPEHKLFRDEVVCPASEEGGRKATCHTCQLCSGSGKAKNVVINAHGRMSEHFSI